MRTRTGKPEFQYEIACAQLCGLGHARMRGFVTVQTADEFQKWMDETDQGCSRRERPLPVSWRPGRRVRYGLSADSARTEHLRRRHPRADPFELLDGDAADAVLPARLFDGPHHHPAHERGHPLHALGRVIVPRDRRSRDSGPYSARHRKARRAAATRRTSRACACRADPRPSGRRSSRRPGRGSRRSGRSARTRRIARRATCAGGCR